MVSGNYDFELLFELYSCAELVKELTAQSLTSQ